ncbi:jg19564 [Pararge aegeria aegeria]|uniref:Jg19564 protein n=1 Tax=Pararge aegeria aegeria TaxID=348720 RepID=A0A8S4R9C4_9NEOP|nr:jg19564 [Pararge aegeria aegeria]
MQSKMLVGLPVRIIPLNGFYAASQRGANNLNVNELENNVKNIIKPIKKLSDIFPNHDIEVQFDIEQTQYHPTGQAGSLKSHKEVRLNNSVFLNNLARLSAFGRLGFTTNKYRPTSPYSYRPEKGVIYKDLPISSS